MVTTTTAAKRTPVYSVNIIIELSCTLFLVFSVWKYIIYSYKSVGASYLILTARNGAWIGDELVHGKEGDHIDHIPKHSHHNDHHPVPPRKAPGVGYMSTIADTTYRNKARRQSGGKVPLHPLEAGFTTSPIPIS